MQAMVLTQLQRPLCWLQAPIPEPQQGEVRIRVEACGVCRTDLHLIDGEVSLATLPRILGHQVVGRVEALGPAVPAVWLHRRVGVSWLWSTCGHCTYCLAGTENLCRSALFTGRDRDGGFAERMLARADYLFELPAEAPAVTLAPLLCAGMIGYRAYRMAGEAQHLGMYGFGAAAHLLTQLAVQQGRAVYAMTRDGDTKGQRFARDLGCVWAGSSTVMPPHPLDAAILFAPEGSLVPHALQAVRPGGQVICAGIHMSDLPSFPYHLLWEERILRSVAHVTRADGGAFLQAVQHHPIAAHVTRYPLEQANLALDALRQGTLQGVAVIQMGSS